MGDGKIMATARNEPLRVGMTPERWQQVKSLLTAALETDPSQRYAYLDGACAGDRPLREEIENLLAIEEESDPELLNRPAAMLAGLEEHSTNNTRIGRHIGPYQIVEEIGIGGMGEVYRAFRADDQYRKQVAIKLVREGQDTRFVVARFKNERQVLASLEHPNIARLLDGGTTGDGIPYFVMELIEGQPIHEYCDRQRLTTTERLKLFLQVCSAVHYAHQRLIIHRDLKPSNILVTADGVPKLLDFGIAKILYPAASSLTSELTISMFRLLTPGYASPEQVKGEVITTASDVYSLGVLLYELLAGCRPDQAAGRAPHEIPLAVCEMEPEKPSVVAWRAETRKKRGGSVQDAPSSVGALREGSPKKLRKRLRGDLDNIVLMALRKEPQRRYASVEQCATDIRRHMEHLSVIATKDTFRYRTSKFVRRHKTGVFAAVTVFLTVLAGLGATLHEEQIARAQKLRAEQRFQDVRELANSLMFDLHDSIQDLPGSTPARKLLVDRALRYLDRLSRDAASDLSIQRELASAYEKVGTVQGNPFGANLGDTEGALESYRKSLAIRELISKANPGSLDDQLALAHGQELIAELISNRLGPDGLEETQQALATAERILQVAPENRSVLHQVRADHGLMALILQAGVGDYQGALSHWRRKLSIEDQLLRATPDDRTLQGIRALTQIYVWTELARLGSRKEALWMLQPPNVPSDSEFKTLGVEGRRVTAWVMGQKGDIQLADGNPKGALGSYKRELQIVEPLTKADPVNAVLDYDYATACANLGNALTFTGNQAESFKMLNRASSMFEKQIAHDPAYVEPRWALARTRIWISESLARGGNRDRALTTYRSQLRDWETMAKYYPLAQVILARIHTEMGSLLAEMRKSKEADEEYKRALDIVEPITTAHPNTVDAQYVLADTYSGLAELSKRLAVKSAPLSKQIQYWNEARDGYKRSLDSWRKIHHPGLKTPTGFECGNPKNVMHDLTNSEAILAKLQAHQTPSTLD
jgi:serine/threonine protein kinase/tetratricopeptide (TPR) repeat protein